MLNGMFNEGRKIAYTIFVNFNVTYSLNVVEKKGTVDKITEEDDVDDEKEEEEENCIMY